MIAAVRLRRRKAADVRSAKGFVAKVLNMARETGETGIRMVRADSKFRTADVVTACRTAGANFSPTTGMDPSITAAIGSLSDDAWVPIRSPDAFMDPVTGETISDAEVTEITCAG
ncbi:MAG TPA: hypothetical protein VIU15_47705 [Streptomyces sp.]